MAKLVEVKINKCGKIEREVINAEYIVSYRQAGNNEYPYEVHLVSRGCIYVDRESINKCLRALGYNTI